MYLCACSSVVDQSIRSTLVKGKAMMIMVIIIKMGTRYIYILCANVCAYVVAMQRKGKNKRTNYSKTPSCTSIRPMMTPLYTNESSRVGSFLFSFSLLRSQKFSAVLIVTACARRSLVFSFQCLFRPACSCWRSLQGEDPSKRAWR